MELMETMLPLASKANTSHSVPPVLVGTWKVRSSCSPLYTATVASDLDSSEEEELVAGWCRHVPHTSCCTGCRSW